MQRACQKIQTQFDPQIHDHFVLQVHCRTCCFLAAFSTAPYPITVQTNASLLLAVLFLKSRSTQGRCEQREQQRSCKKHTMSQYQHHLQQQQPPQQLSFLARQPFHIGSTTTPNSPSTNTAPAAPAFPSQHPATSSSPLYLDFHQQYQQKQQQTDQLLQQVLHVLKQQSPHNYAQIQQQFQQQFHEFSHDDPVLPSNSPTMSLSPIQRPVTMSQPMSTSPVPIKKFSDAVKPAPVLPQPSPQQSSPQDYDDDLFETNTVAVFVSGTWKHCSFNQTQLLREFAVIPRKLIKKLVSMSEKESWGGMLLFFLTACLGNNEVLLSYLNYTFRRLVDEKKIMAYFPDDKKAPVALCFNSGLLTTQYERIFCFLAPNKNLKDGPNLANSHKKFVEWFVTLFVKESDVLKPENNIIRTKLGCSPIAVELLPQRTSYFTDKEKSISKEMVWNLHTSIEPIPYAELTKHMRQNDQIGQYVYIVLLITRLL